MKKEDKRKMKQFKLDKKIDFIIYLQELIVRLDKCIVKQKKYLLRLKEFIEKNKIEKIDMDIKDIIINIEKYEEFLNLLSGTESYMLNLVGDGQSMAISYFKFREIVRKRKKKGTLDFEIRDIEDSDNEILSQLNKLRNWYNHVPESLLMSEIKLIQEGELNSHSENPIEVNYYNYCTLEYVVDLYNQSNELYKGVRHIHQCIKRDYSSLIGERVKINRVYYDKIMGIEHTSIAKLSAKVQGLSE